MFLFCTTSRPNLQLVDTHLTEWIAHRRRLRNLARRLKPNYSDNAEAAVSSLISGRRTTPAIWWVRSWSCGGFECSNIIVVINSGNSTDALESVEKTKEEECQSMFRRADPGFQTIIAIERFKPAGIDNAPDI